MKSKILIVSLLFFFTSLNGVEAKTYYTSPNGSDNNSGTQESPWASPGYASRQLETGDNLIILGGTYYLSEYDADIITPPSGKKGDWTIIRGEKGNRPVLKGSNNLLTAINLPGNKYVKIKNLEITSNNGANFREAISGVEGQLRHIIINNLYIHHLDEFGIDLKDVNHITIDNTKIKYTGFGAIGGPEAEFGGWRNVLIRDSWLSYSGHYYQGEDKLGPYDRPDGFGIEESNGPIRIVRTRANHNMGDGLDLKSKNTYINRCIVANNYADGIKLWQGDSEVRNTLIYGRGGGDTTTTPWAPIVIGSDNTGDVFKLKNNTIDDEVGNNYVASLQYDDSENIKLIMKNNIFSSRGANNSPVYIGASVNAKIKNNLFYFPNSDRILDYGNDSYTKDQTSSFGKNNIYGKPKFTKKYRLKKKSPARKVGMKKGAPKYDLRGKKRLENKTVDLGAYEK